MVAGPGAGWDSADVLERVLDTARKDDFEGSSKHDALNARWLEKLAGTSRPRRLVATQLVMRSPVDVRNLAGVRKARNAKGLSLVLPGAALPVPHDRGGALRPGGPRASSTG